MDRGDVGVRQPTPLIEIVGVLEDRLPIPPFPIGRVAGIRRSGIHIPLVIAERRGEIGADLPVQPTLDVVLVADSRQVVPQRFVLQPTQLVVLVGNLGRSPDVIELDRRQLQPVPVVVGVGGQHDTRRIGGRGDRVRLVRFDRVAHEVVLGGGTADTPEEVLFDGLDEASFGVVVERPLDGAHRTPQHRYLLIGLQTFDTAVVKKETARKPSLISQIMN